MAFPDLRNLGTARSPSAKTWGKPSVLLPTPDISNAFVVIETATVDSKTTPTAYGTAHPTATAAVLIDQRFEGEANSQKNHVRVYATYGSASQQDAYNFTTEYLANSLPHRVVTRVYTLPRSGYAPLAKKTADSVFTDAKLTYETHQPIEGDNAHWRVIRVFEELPGPILLGSQLAADADGATIEFTTQTVWNDDGAPSIDFRYLTYERTPIDSLKSTQIVRKIADEASFPQLLSEIINERGDVVMRTIQTIDKDEAFTLVDLGERVWNEAIDLNKSRQITEQVTHSTLSGYRMAADAQGETATISDSIVAPLATQPSLSHLTLDYRRDPINNAESRQVLVTVNSFPTLIDDQLIPGYEDAQTSGEAQVRIRTTKQVIAAPADPIAQFNASTKTLTEYQALDKWRSIQIVSKLTGLPADRVWYEYGQASFPDELISATIGTRVIINVSDTSTGDPVAVGRYDVYLKLDIREGYSGPVRMKITEKYRWSLPGDADLPTPLKWWPEAHDIFIYGASSGDAFLGGQNAHIPRCLHGAIVLTGNADPGSISATEPAGLPYGSYVVKDAQARPWRLGAYVWTIIEMQVPALT